MSINVWCVCVMAGVSDDIMLIGKDRKPFSSIGQPEVHLQPASDGVRYQLIDASGNETSSADVWKSKVHDAVNQLPVEDIGLAPSTSPTREVLTSSVTSSLRHTPENVNISSQVTAATDREVRVRTTVSKSRLRLETALASRGTERAAVAAGNYATTQIYYDTERSATNEALGNVMASNLRTTDDNVDTGNRKRSLYLNILGEKRPLGSSLHDVNTSAFTVSASREQHDSQLASTTRLPEVNSTTNGGVGNQTGAWNADEQTGSTQSTAIRVRYVHTSLTEDNKASSTTWLQPTELASISAACVLSFLLVVVVVVFAVCRRRRVCRRSKVGGGDGGKPSCGDEKLKVLRRVAAESDTLSPDLLDQIIRAELARGRAKRYRARLRNGDDREQLERLAVELSDDWGTPPPSYRRLTPVTVPTHRRPQWPTDSPARVHDLQPPLPDLPPPIPERSFASRPTAMPLDFRQFRRPLPEVPPPQSADQFEMTSGPLTPKLSDMRTVDVTAAAPCDVIRSPLAVPVCTTQDGGTGSGKRRRFPKMGRSCLLESLRQRGDSVDACSRPHAGQSTDVATTSCCACAAGLPHPVMTSWTRDLSHLPILRDTTV